MATSRLLGVVLTSAVCAPAAVTISGETAEPPDAVALESFSGRVLATGLEGPWEMTWAPDDMLWVTERVGGRIDRIDPESGEVSTLVTLDGVLSDQQHQGLLGMALHPDLLAGGSSNYVYVYHTYDSTPDSGDDQDDPRAKVVRLTYDQATETLGDPTELISGIPAGNDHNGGRLAIGPDGMLYVTLGEQGANQFDNFCTPIEAQRLPTPEEVAAQDWAAYKGKTLRMTLDGAIPDDNPELDGVRSHIYSYGHRNPQGIVFGPDGSPYLVEHGANTDDEVNLLQAGGNFGWPHVAGYRDDQAYAFANWSAATDCEQLTWTNLTDDESVPDEVPVQLESEWDGEFVEPLTTLFTVQNDYDLEDDTCGELYFICRPSVAPSSVDYYPADGPIVGWGDSLLATTLKAGAVYRFMLSGDGNGIRDIDRMFGTVNRYRDLAISNDGLTIYVATDMAGIVRSADGGATDELANPGSILAFTYDGDAATD